eukprot:4565775-Amphidinium_carterae.1
MEPGSAADRMEPWSAADAHGARECGRRGSSEEVPRLALESAGQQTWSWECEEKKGTEERQGQRVGSVFRWAPRAGIVPPAMFFNFSHRTVCLQCNAPKGVGFPPAGSKGKGAGKEALGEQILKKQIAEAESGSNSAVK